MAVEWDKWRKEVAAGKKDWIGAAQSSEYGEYLYRARKRFERGEAATVRQIKNIYRRVAASIRSDIENLTPGTLRHSHLNALAGSLEKAVKQVNTETLAAVQSGIRLAVDEATSGPEQVTMDLLDEVFDRPSIKWMFADINQRAVLSILSRTRHEGLKLSDRVWRISQNARKAITMLVEDGVTRGLDVRTLAKEVQSYLQPDKWTALKAETRRRLGVPKNVSMEAMRLAVTEMQHAFHEGTINSYRAIPSAKGIYWRLSSSHPIPDVCDDYASHNGNGFWPKGQEPAKPHPWCRCVAIPAMEDPKEFTQRLKEWMKDPSSQPDIEMWYNNTARRFLKRPSQSASFAVSTAEQFARTVWGKHGWTSNSKEEAQKLSEDLRKRTLETGLEYAGMIEVDSGKRLGSILEGGSSGVNIKKHIDGMVSGKRYIQIHTHPGSSSFSDADVKLLFYHQGPDRNIQSIFVIGGDGTRYIISRKPGSKIADAQEIAFAYKAEIEKLMDKWKPKVLSGELSQQEAWKQHTHEAWKNIADKLGLIYDRLE